MTKAEKKIHAKKKGDITFVTEKKESLFILKRGVSVL